MWNIRKYINFTYFRSRVRQLFNIIFYTGKIVEIARGPLKGLKWYCHTEHQFWMPLGIYENETTEWLLNNMTSETIFYDIGANAGYFTLLGAKHSKMTIGFEPVPVNFQVIKNHIELNNFQNVGVEAIAISNNIGRVNFTHEKNNANSHLSAIETPHAKNEGIDTLEVNMTTLDEYVKENSIPTLMKIDVEGAEVLVLEGAKDTLKHNKIQLIISTHSKQLETTCINLLRNYGYETANLKGFEHEIIAKNF